MSEPTHEPIHWDIREVAARDPQRFKRLPEPLRPEDLRTAHEVTPPHHPENEAYRELAWMLRTAGIP